MRSSLLRTLRNTQPDHMTDPAPDTRPIDDRVGRNGNTQAVCSTHSAVRVGAAAVVDIAVADSAA